MVKKNVEFHRGIVEHDLRERKVQLNSTTEWKNGKVGSGEREREFVALANTPDEILTFGGLSSRLWRGIHRCFYGRRRRSFERRRSYPSLEG